MHSSDLKKLITGFLILSAFSGSLTLIFLNSADKSAPLSSLNQTEADGFGGLTTSGQNSFLDSTHSINSWQAGSPQAIGKNAFVEQLPQNSFGFDRLTTGSSQSAQTGTANDSASADNQPIDTSGFNGLTTSNLTQNFSKIFAQQVIEHNPDGPQLDSSGKPAALNLPDENSAAALIQQAITTSTFAIDEKILDSDIKIIAAYAANDGENYFNAVASALADFTSSTKRIDAANQSSTPETIVISQLIFESSLAKLKAASVPQPLAAFHKSLLGFFSNQKKVFEIAGNYRIDPLKTIIVLQSENEIVNRDVKRIQNELEKIPGKISYYPEGKNDIASLARQIFGIQTAYAQFEAVSVPTSNLPQWLKTVFQVLQDAAQWVKSHAYEIWKWAYTTALRIAVKLLIDTFQNQVVNWIAGNGNPKFITDWKGFLTDIGDKAVGETLFKIAPFLCSNIGPLIRIAILPVPSIDTSVRCTLTQIVGNLTAFYDNFQNGGWIAYGAALQPQNNFFGGLIIANDIVMREAAAAVGAAQNEGIASQGFLSVKKCVKSHVISDPGGIGDTTVCDEYVNQTPGAVVGSTLTEALKWPQNQWVNAQRFEELIGAIINAGINRMMREGLSALTAASNPSRTDFDSAIPPGVTNPGDISSLKSSLQTLVSTYQQNGAFQKFQDVSDADGQWLALLPSVISALNQVGLSCPSLTASAQQKIAELNSLRNNVTAEFLNASANTYDSFQAKIANATSTGALANIPDQLQNLANITVDVAVAQNRLTRLQNLRTNAQANLPSNCNVPLLDTAVAAPLVLPPLTPP